MNPVEEFSTAELEVIEQIVARYIGGGFDVAQRFADVLLVLFSSKELTPLIHSLKARAKDPDHLRDKLKRQMRKAKAEGEEFDISPDNLSEKINDLTGARILHLHTSQFAHINRVLTELLLAEDYKIIEGPIARTWDDEYREIFDAQGIQTTRSKRLYTSVHYVIEVGRVKKTAEIQVRTLAEELWGEVDHAINYPEPSLVFSCKEQIKVLARLTSSCTRLVDSIFSSKHDADGNAINKEVT